MTRSSRLMAAMLAALFAAVARFTRVRHRHAARCARHARTYGSRLQGRGHEVPRPRRRRQARQRVSPASPASASGRTTTTTASATAASPTTTPTPPAATRSPASTRRRPAHDDQRQALPPARAALLRQRHGRLGLHATRTPRPRAASPPAPAAASAAAGARSTRRRRRTVTGKDFGNYRKAKITVIKKPRSRPRTPAASTSRSTAPPSRPRRATAAPAASSSSPARIRSPRPAAAGTSLADYAASTDCKTTIGPRTYGPDWVHLGSGDEVVCTITNVRHGKVEIAKQTDPARDRRHRVRLHRLRRARSASPTARSRRSRTSSRAASPTRSPSRPPRATACPRSPATTATAPARSARAPRASASRAGETVRCTFVNTKLVPAIEVVKAGPARLHHGDTMEFTFAVRSAGNSPLHAVKVTDDRCAPVSADAGHRRPATTATRCSRTARSGSTAARSRCRRTPPARADPLCNVATATGQDEEDKPVTDTDKHCTDILHPAIALAKTADRETAQVGDTITLSLRRHQPR